VVHRTTTGSTLDQVVRDVNLSLPEPFLCLAESRQLHTLDGDPTASLVGSFKHRPHPARVTNLRRFIV
jgi:hypothetical protein